MKYILTLLMLMSLETTLINFSDPNEIPQWQIVNDGVMGGLSKSTIQRTEEGTAVFSGRVSLENNGGFASVQRRVDISNVSSYKHVQIKLKGDQKDYQLRLKHDASDYASYIQSFSTSGEWEIINLKIEDFYPSFRGRKLPMPNFTFDQIEQITFLISNKVKEDFALEVAWIKMVE